MPTDLLAWNQNAIEGLECQRASYQKKNLNFFLIKLALAIAIAVAIIATIAIAIAIAIATPSSVIRVPALIHCCHRRQH